MKPILSSLKPASFKRHRKRPGCKSTINFRRYSFSGCYSRYNYPLGLHQGMQQIAEC